MAAVANSDVRQSRREAEVGALFRGRKSSFVNRKELPPKYCRRTNTSSKWKEEEDLLRALAGASAFVEEERAVWLRLALFANAAFGARGAVLCAALTAATSRRGPRALGAG